MIAVSEITTKRARAEAERLLLDSALRPPERLDALYGAYGEDGQLLGCGGYCGRVIQCVAVAPGARGEGVMSALVTRLVGELRTQGHRNLFVFTKPEHAEKFTSLGFYPLAATGEAALLESRRDGIGAWLDGLPRGGAGENGAIVMNANPFTEGHRALIVYAASRCASLYVFVLSEEASRFRAAERLSLVREGCAGLKNVFVCAGGDYCISAATFPDYFIKRASDASRVHAELDAALFGGRIAPALQIKTRFLGSEPFDELTRQYNDALRRVLLAQGVRTQIMERAELGGAPVSASRVRVLLGRPDFSGACALVPPCARPYLIGRLAAEALIAEADATPKPGLVDAANSGAHRDMDRALLCASALALEPYLRRFTQLGTKERALPLEGGLDRLRPLGIEAETKMKERTRGVNTHRGAVFTLGIFCYLAGRSESCRAASLCADAARLCAGLTGELAKKNSSNGTAACAAYGGTGIRGEAESGYPSILHLALPALREQLRAGATQNDALTWALMHLIAKTEDTNLLHRGGAEGLEWARAAAAAYIGAHPAGTGSAEAHAALTALDAAFIRRNLSPGGSADLLAAAWFLYTLCGMEEGA